MAICLKKRKKELKRNFANRIVIDNSKRFVALTGCISAIQIVILVLRAFNVMGLEKYSSLGMITILGFGVLSSFILTRIRRRAEITNRTTVLTIVIMTMHIVLLLIGAHYTFEMFKNGTFTFSFFLILAFFVSMSHVRWPYISAVLLVIIFAIMAYIIQIRYEVPPDFNLDVMTTFILVVLVGVATVLNYNKYQKIYVNENDIKDMNERLTELSEKDMLTGIYNRRKIAEKLGEFVNHAQRYKTDFSVVMIDIDKFKKINDKHGHSAGDYVLKEITKILNENLRESDVFGRWGGEEFIMLLPNSDEKAAFAMVDRMRDIIQNHEFNDIGKVTFSAGICGFRQKYTEDNMVDKADFALYLSKQLGRNKVSIFKAA